MWRCRLINEHPQVLDVEAFEKAVNEAKHIMPNMNISHMMRMNPSMIFSFQRGSDLIPYDEPLGQHTWLASRRQKSKPSQTHDWAFEQHRATPCLKPQWLANVRVL